MVWRGGQGGFPPPNTRFYDCLSARLVTRWYGAEGSIYLTQLFCLHAIRRSLCSSPTYPSSSRASSGCRSRQPRFGGTFIVVTCGLYLMNTITSRFLTGSRMSVACASLHAMGCCRCFTVRYNSLCATTCGADVSCRGFHNGNFTVIMCHNPL